MSGRRLERDLAGEAAVVLASDCVPMTSPELARRLGVRRDAVDRMLETDGRFMRLPAPPGRSPRAKTWGLATVAATEAGTSGTSAFQATSARVRGAWTQPIEAWLPLPAEYRGRPYRDDDLEANG
jgi:hypothetical protein